MLALPGETYMIGSARSPRWHEEVVRPSRWQGRTSLAQVSRSRAMPTGGRRSKRFPRFLRVGDSWFAALRAACRPEVGGPSGPRDFCAWGIRGLLPSGQRAGRRPALQPSPRFFSAGGMRFRGLRPRGCRRSLLGPSCPGYAGFLSRKSFQARARRVFSPWLTSAVTTWRASEGSVMSGTPRSTARRRTR